MQREAFHEWHHTTYVYKLSYTMFNSYTYKINLNSSAHRWTLTIKVYKRQCMNTTRYPWIEPLMLWMKGICIWMSDSLRKNSTWDPVNISFEISVTSWRDRECRLSLDCPSFFNLRTTTSNTPLEIRTQKSTKLCHPHWLYELQNKTIWWQNDLVNHFVCGVPRSTAWSADC